jgi:hypothetical protein
MFVCVCVCDEVQVHDTTLSQSWYKSSYGFESSNPKCYTLTSTQAPRPPWNEEYSKPLFFQARHQVNLETHQARLFMILNQQEQGYHIIQAISSTRQIITSSKVMFVYRVYLHKPYSLKRVNSPRITKASPSFSCLFLGFTSQTLASCSLQDNYKDR